MEERRRRGETQADHQQIRRGWRLGDDQFRKELLGVGKSAGGSHYKSKRQERDQEGTYTRRRNPDDNEMGGNAGIDRTHVAAPKRTAITL